MTPLFFVEKVSGGRVASSVVLMAATVVAPPAAAAALAAASAPLAILLLMWQRLRRRPKKRSCWQSTQLAADAFVQFTFSTLSTAVVWCARMMFDTSHTACTGLLRILLVLQVFLGSRL